MKEKTSITLSSEVLAGVDRLAGSKVSRSAFIERVLRRYLRERARARAQAHDRQRINEAAERLNAEATDVLEYQSSGEGPEPAGTLSGAKLTELNRALRTALDLR